MTWASCAPVVSVPLSRAAVCLSCEAVTDVGYRRCPACGRDDLMLLTRWLDRSRPTR